MPHRFLASQVEVLFGALVGLLASVGGIENLTSSAIWDKTQLRIFCLLGAIGGAFITIILFPPPQTGNQARQLAGKFLASGLSGLIFTPVIIRWQGWPVDVDIVLCVAATVAICSVTLITNIVPMLQRKLLGTASSALGDNPDASNK